MSTADHHKQLDRVRERFTRTAEQFAKFSLSTRSDEAELLVRLLAPRGQETALDLACGPGTFLLALAPRVKFIHGLDLTLPLIKQAQDRAANQRLTNLAFHCGEATAVPLADASMDLAVCGYSLHHFAEPGRVVVELARVLRRSAHFGVVDLIVPGAAQAYANNEIEKARDASHARTLGADEIRAVLESSGFRILAWETRERWRSFDDWMQIAGWQRGDSAYRETRRLMEVSMVGDTAGFHPRFASPAPSSPGPAQDEIQFVQTSLFVVGEKL